MLALDNVAQYIDSVGTDETQSMSGAVPSYRTVAQMLTTLGVAGPIGVQYRIEDGDQWEIGWGSVSGGSLQRSYVIDSSDDGARINLVGDPDMPILYLVSGAMSDGSVTPYMGTGSGPGVGARVAPGKLGGTGLGSAAQVDDAEGTAVGALSRARVSGASAVGALSVGRVTGALSVGDGDAQAVTWVGRAQTNDDSTVRTQNRFGHPFIPWTTGAYLINAQVIGRRTSPSVAVYAATLTAVVYRIGAGSVPVLVGSVVKAVNGQSAGVTCDCDIEIDTEPYEIAAGIEVEGGVAVMVSGASAQTWEWSVAIRAVEQAG